MMGPEKPEEISPDYSVEFCGGTHLGRTGSIGYFKILGQEAVGKGVRRLTAVTGRRAAEEVQKLSGVVEELRARLQCNPEQLPARVESLQEEVKKLQTQLKKGAAVDVNAAADTLLAGALEVNGSKVITGELPPAPRETMLQQLDRLRQKAKSAAILLAWVEEGKVSLLAGMTEDVVKKGLQAGKIIGEVARVVGGKGGGRPDMAQAGGTDPAKLPDALALARKLLADKLGA
jgi:alanyl-tRNA synthetase